MKKILLIIVLALNLLAAPTSWAGSAVTPPSKNSTNAVLTTPTIIEPVVTLGINSGGNVLSLTTVGSGGGLVVPAFAIGRDLRGSGNYYEDGIAVVLLNLSVREYYFTGLPAASLAITMSDEAIGSRILVMSTAARPAVTWASPAGYTFINAPTSLAAGVGYTFRLIRLFSGALAWIVYT